MLALAPGQETTIRISVKAKPGQQDEEFFIDAQDADPGSTTDSVGFALDIKPFNSGGYHGGRVGKPLLFFSIV